MKYLERDGVKLAYREIHEVENHQFTMVFLHGMTGDHTSWKNQAIHWKDCARIISVDMRGRGHSDKPLQTYPISLIAEDLHYIIKELVTGPLVLVGHSYGGFACLQVAVEHPELLRGLVLADSYLLPVRDARFYAEAEELVRGLRSEHYAEVLREFYTPLVGSRDEHWMAMFMRKQLQTNIDIIASSFEELWQTDMTEYARRLTVPTIYIGAHRMDTGRSLKELAPHVQLAEIVGASHLLHLDNPIEFNNYVEGFLRKLAL